MKLYLTSESYYRVKNGFTNIHTFAIIDINLILDTLKLDMSKQSNIYLINSEIKKLLMLNAKNRKYKGIIYIAPSINKDVINNINMFVNEISTIDDVILLDDYDAPKLKDYYNCVEEVMFFSTFKKIKIIECKPIMQQRETT